MGWKKHPVIVLSVLGLAVHAATLAAVRARVGRIDGYAFGSLDAGEYDQIARNMADHGAHSQSPAPPLKPDTWRTPGYPLFLALLMVLFGKAPATLVIAQQFLSIANVLLLYCVARGVMSERRALVVALLFLFEPYHLFYSTWLLATTQLITVLLIGWLIWLEALHRGQWGWFALLGMASGVGILVWPGSLLLPVLLVSAGIVMWLFRASTHRPRYFGRTWPTFAAYGIGLIMTVGPWVIRNHQVAGTYGLSNQSGVVLAYFKAAEVVLWRQGRSVDRYLELSTDPTHAAGPHAVWESIDRELRRALGSNLPKVPSFIQWPQLVQGNKTTLDSFLLSRILRGIAWSYLIESPTQALSCYLVRCVDNLTFPLSLATRPPAGIVTHRPLAALKSVPYVALCAAVAWRLFRGRRSCRDLFFPLIVTGALILTTAPQVDPRFRAPMIPFLVFVAALPRKARGPGE